MLMAALRLKEMKEVPWEISLIKKMIQEEIREIIIREVLQEADWLMILDSKWDKKQEH